MLGVRLRDRSPLRPRQHDRARSIEREQAGRSIDDDFARAALRLYTEHAAVAADADSRAFAEMYAALLAGAPHEFPIGS